MRWYILLALLALVSTSFGDSIDNAEAKRRGVSVEVIQLENARVRIADLEDKNDYLKKDNAVLQNASPPTTAPTVDPTKVTNLDIAKAIIADLEKDNAALKKQSSEARAKYGAQIADEKAARDALELARVALELARETPIQGDVAVGKSGLVRRLRIVQVINKNEAIVEILTPHVPSGGGAAVAMDPYQAALSSARSSPLPDTATEAYLIGFDTSAWTDGKVIDFGQAVNITKTKQYTSVSGASRTVLLAEKL